MNINTGTIVTGNNFIFHTFFDTCFNYFFLTQATSKYRRNRFFLISTGLARCLKSRATLSTHELPFSLVAKYPIYLCLNQITPSKLKKIYMLFSKLVFLVNTIEIITKEAYFYFFARLKNFIMHSTIAIPKYT